MSVGSDILAAAATKMPLLTVPSDAAAPAAYSKATAVSVQNTAVDRAFSVLATSGRDLDIVSPAGTATRTMGFVVRVVFFNEGRSETDHHQLMVQEAERIQDAIPYYCRTTVAGCHECLSAGDWTVQEQEEPGVYLLEVPFRCVYTDTHRTT